MMMTESLNTPKSHRVSLVKADYNCQKNENQENQPPPSKLRRLSTSLKSLHGCLIEKDILAVKTSMRKRRSRVNSSSLYVINIPEMNSSMSKRHQIVIELLEKERNYARILNYMLKLKTQIEVEKILKRQDIILIFGSIPEIFHLHYEILNELNSLVRNWREDCTVGDLFSKIFNRLYDVYSPYVKYQDRISLRLQELNVENEEFRLFNETLLKGKECRESLSDLIIRPIQKLPSMLLLLEKLFQETEIEQDDYPLLDRTLKQLRAVNFSLNEGKRRTDNQVKLFELNKTIDGLPPTLLSSNRNFIRSVDVLCLAKNIVLTIFLFDDQLVLAKHIKTKRSITHKFLEEIHLCKIKRIIDLKDGKITGFGIAIENGPTHEIIRLFEERNAADETSIKNDLLKTLSRYQTKSEKEIHQDKNLLSRATRCLNRRTFSFSKTPQSLQKVMSSISHAISPKTPLNRLSGLRNRRLAFSSMLDLSESKENGNALS